jgi:Cof subfamily protein (haloacid dehalogenase superfamily)
MSGTHTIRAVAIDIDGTLLNSRHELSDEVEAALRKAAAQGVHIILATGKSRNAALHIIEHLGLQTHGIFVQGTVLYDAAGTITHDLALNDDLLRRLLTYIDDRKFNAILYSGSRMFTARVTEDIRAGTVPYHEPLPKAVGSLMNLVGQMPFQKLVVLGPDARTVTALRWQLGQQLGASVRLMQAGIATMLEVLPPGAGKEAMLKAALDDLGIPPEQAMAIGDAENDIGMIRLAGIGVAMGQAAQHVREVAQHVTASNDEHGVARAIERFVLRHEPTEAQTVVIEIPRVAPAQSPETPV